MEAEPAIIAARWVVGLLVFGGFGAYTAYRKGYSLSWWFLAGGGCLGLLIQAYLPNTKNRHMTREQKAKLRKRGNIIGMIITSIVVILHILLVAKFLNGK